MPRTFDQAREEILRHVGDARRSVFKRRELESLFATPPAAWQLPRSATPSRFIRFLEAEGRLHKLEIKSPKYRGEVRYAWGTPSPYEVALSLRPAAYLSHGTALSLHGLLDQVPQVIYVNKEQSPKPRSAGHLTQDRLDFAFSRRQRESGYVFTWDGGRAVILSGKNTGRLQVGAVDGPSGEHLEATGLERTLVDIVVRPVYAGGVFAVLDAYRQARERASPAKLVEILAALDYVYPYHQAIGFLMERAGYPAAAYEPLRARGLDVDFYLQHGLVEPAYDAGWRLFHPEGL
ncbi:MAG: hypothetical protein IH621_00050 [Krumholzibacteria bacterium]|nr:hypothetical protein [Candidatus Krumholzibacteria bacterium]